MPSSAACRSPNKSLLKIRHTQGVVQGEAGAHVAVFDTGAQKTMLGDGGWEIIKNHDRWIDTRGVNLGGSSKAGR